MSDMSMILFLRGEYFEIYAPDAPRAAEVLGLDIEIRRFRTEDEDLQRWVEFDMVRFPVEPAVATAALMKLNNANIPFHVVDCGDMGAEMPTLYELTEEFERLAEALVSVEQMRQEAEEAERAARTLAKGNGHGGEAIEQAARAEQLVAEFREAEAHLNARLEAVGDDLAEKCDGYAWLIKDFDARAAAWRAREREFGAKAKALEKARERLKGAVQGSMEQLGADKICGQEFTFSLQRNGRPGVLEVNEAAALEAGLAAEVTQVVPDKDAIVAAWRRDPASVEGIAVVEQGRHLRIRA